MATPFFDRYQLYGAYALRTALDTVVSTGALWLYEVCCHRLVAVALANAVPVRPPTMLPQLSCRMYSLRIRSFR